MASYEEIVKAQSEYFQTTVTKSVYYRISMLKQLKKSILENEQAIFDALKQDLNKSAFETYASEIGMVLSEINFAIKHLVKWARPKTVRTPLVLFKGKSRIFPEPYGVALIISPWNYPFQLTMSPLVSALAAGNTAILKPSEFTPHVSAVIEKIIHETFEARYVEVILGDKDASQELLQQKFDTIFFTGSTAVGKLVMADAAKNLTPVTLELGGKSPCIVDRTANLKLAAKQIVFGKTLNAGQTCVAPDYVLVDELVKEPLIRFMKEHIKTFWGEQPNENPEYVQIINERHFNRLIGLMQNQEIVAGGGTDATTRHIEPTILDNVDWDSPVMQEEIFGPILPILFFKNLDEAIQMVKSRPRPLAFYGFTTSKVNEKRFIQELSFGGGAINETLMHLVSPYLPFGGVGDSGFGVSHGKAGFDTFTHYKSVLKKSNSVDIPLRYPPYGQKLRLVKKIMK